MSLDLSRLQLRAGKVTAQVASAIVSVTLDAAEASVAALTISLDDAGVLASSGLADAGSTVLWDGTPWMVGGVTTRWNDDATVRHDVACRSRLARALRRTYKASAESQVSPSEWVTRRVAAAGGTAICQPSARRSTIAQTSGDERQSELDVIESLAADLGWSWMEFDGRLLFGSPFWAWSARPSGQKVWPITWRRHPGSDALTVEVAVDDDDTDFTATGSTTVPASAGDRVRPWDLLRLTGFGARDGDYLVTKVSRTADPAAPTALDFAQPRRESTKAGSSS